MTDQPDAWTPPPPSDRREELPAAILSLLPERPYTSTACDTGYLLEADTYGAVRRWGRKLPDGVTLADLETWIKRLHQRCRLNHKFTGRTCSCQCHGEQPTGVVADCRTCRGHRIVPDYTCIDKHYGEPKPKPCPDCQTAPAPSGPAATEATEPAQCPPGVHSIFDPCPGDCGKPLVDEGAPSGLREHYAAATERYFKHDWDPTVPSKEGYLLLADAVLAVRDRKMEQLGEELDAAAATIAHLTVETNRLRAELADEEEATRRILGQRQELAAERYAWQEHGDRLAATLQEVLAHFTRETHPGQRCLQTGHVPVGTVDRWRAALTPPKEPTP